MTKEQAIEEINKAFEPAFANYIITALTEGATVSDKALEQQPSDDCISRQAVVKYIEACGAELGHDLENESVREDILNMPPVTPTHGTCKDCKYNVDDGKTIAMCDIGHRFYMREPSTFYCADFEKRGNENG